MIQELLRIAGILATNLPTKFHIPDTDCYSGVGCLKIHLRLSTFIRTHSLSNGQLNFPMSLSGRAQRWFA